MKDDTQDSAVEQADMPYSYITWKEARRLGYMHYFTGKACPKGHISKRMVSDRGCITCKLESKRKWAANNATAIEKYRIKNRDKILQDQNERRWADPRHSLLNSAASRARFKGLDFNLVLSDIPIPDTCPILGIPIVCRRTRDKWDKNPSAPSLDRIDNTKGYVRGNVQVVSVRANLLKSDATPREIECLHVHNQRLQRTPKRDWIFV